MCGVLPLIAMEESGSCGESINLSLLNWEQVQRLDNILTGSIPIHGRWSFPTLEMKPRDIVKVVRSRMEEKRIHVREVRLNGSAASYVLHEDSGLGWKDLDLIFCAELKGEMEFQIVKDIVLDSLLDFLPEGVNKDKITPVTLKVVYEIMTHVHNLDRVIYKAGHVVLNCTAFQSCQETLCVSVKDFSPPSVQVQSVLCLHCISSLTLLESLLLLRN